LVDPSPGESAATSADEARRLRDLNAELAQVAGGLAHEIRNPLSTMRLNLDLLAEDFQDPDSPRDRRILQRLDRVRKESHRLEAILEDFLRLVRVRELHTELVDLNAIVDELRDFTEPLATQQGVLIRTHYADDLDPVRLDADLFKQALLNLIRNAQQAMPQGGELILTTRGEPGLVVLDVIDTGSGVPHEALPRIFEAFFSTRPGGTGLGLPYARKVIEAHGGTIQLESEPGKGSKFTLRLPAATRPEH
jgi:signal transduction histidine kinase